MFLAAAGPFLHPAGIIPGTVHIKPFTVQHNSVPCMRIVGYPINRNTGRPAQHEISLCIAVTHAVSPQNGVRPVILVAVVIIHIVRQPVMQIQGRLPVRIRPAGGRDAVDFDLQHICAGNREIMLIPCRRAIFVDHMDHELIAAGSNKLRGGVTAHKRVCFSLLPVFIDPVEMGIAAAPVPAAKIAVHPLHVRRRMADQANGPVAGPVQGRLTVTGDQKAVPGIIRPDGSLSFLPLRAYFLREFLCLNGRFPAGIFLSLRPCHSRLQAQNQK